MPRGVPSLTGGSRPPDHAGLQGHAAANSRRLLLRRPPGAIRRYADRADLACYNRRASATLPHDHLEDEGPKRPLP